MRNSNTEIHSINELFDHLGDNPALVRRYFNEIIDNSTNVLRSQAKWKTRKEMFERLEIVPGIYTPEIRKHFSISDIIELSMEPIREIMDLCAAGLIGYESGNTVECNIKKTDNNLIFDIYLPTDGKVHKRFLINIHLKNMTDHRLNRLAIFSIDHIEKTKRIFWTDKSTHKELFWFINGFHGRKELQELRDAIYKYGIFSRKLPPPPWGPCEYPTMPTA